MNNSSGHPVVFFDGVCNLCNGLVLFIIRHDREGKFRFSALQSETAGDLLRAFSVPPGEIKTIVLLEGGKFYLRSAAVLRILSQLDGGWKLTKLLYVIPAFLRDAVYNLVSKYRYKIFGKQKSCMTPTPEIKNRFIL